MTDNILIVGLTIVNSIMLTYIGLVVWTDYKYKDAVEDEKKQRNK